MRWRPRRRHGPSAALHAAAAAVSSQLVIAALASFTALAQVSSTSRCRQCDAGRFSPTVVAGSCASYGFSSSTARAFSPAASAAATLGSSSGFLAAAALALPNALRVLSASTHSLFSTLDACAAMRLPTAFVSSACSSGRPRTSAVSQASTSISSTRPVGTCGPQAALTASGAASPELGDGVPHVEHEAVGRLISSGLHARGPRPLATAQEHAHSAIKGQYKDRGARDGLRNRPRLMQRNLVNADGIRGRRPPASRNLPR
eukprot:scaffold32512_cov37-Phaeocystis_antarctica.AAC.2